MRSLAAAYALLAALALPTILWAQDPPAATTTPAATAPATTTPTPAAPTPAPQTPPAAPDAAPAKPAARERVAPAATERPAAPVARTAVSGGVTIEDFAFRPRTITVDEGDTVTWSNRDGVGHSATADDGSFDTGLLARGESGSHTFDAAGTYPYHCTPHPNMTATVVVRAAGGGGSTGAGGGGDDGGEPTDGAAGTGSASSGSTLPATGLQVGLLLAGGVVLLGAGGLLRRRLDG